MQYKGRLTRREYLAAWAGLCALAIIPRYLSGEAFAQASPEELVAAMNEGGRVIFLRHAANDAITQVNPTEIDLCLLCGGILLD